MPANLRINHFAESAHRAYVAQNPQYLCADSHGLSVRHCDLPSSFSNEGRDLNKLSWKIFRESLVGTIGQRKFDWICHRYRSHFNFARLEKSGAALLPEHVELFSIGCNQLLLRDIKMRFPEKVKSLTRQQLQGRIQQVQPFPLVGRYQDPVKIAGCPSSLSALFFHDKLLMDKEKQLLFSDVERLTYPTWLERFTKVTVNRELVEGQLIPAPGLDGRLDYYVVYRKIATGDGLVAYAMKPAAKDSTLKPLITFRPSQWALSNEDTFETYMNDVQKNVGELGWNAAKRHFEQLMEDSHFRKGNQRIAVSGYSLGGAHAQYFLVEHADRVSDAIFYGDPSAPDAIAENFAQRMNAAPRRDEPLNIQIFRMKRDFCQYVGGKHVGWGIDHPDVHIQLIEFDHDNQQIASFYLHAHRAFDNTTFSYHMQCYEDAQALFNHLDNSKRGPDVFWYERTRRVWGGIGFSFFWCLSKMVKFISSTFGVKILRSSKAPDL